jgi:hypothetical protein
MWSFMKIARLFDPLAAGPGETRRSSESFIRRIATSEEWRLYFAQNARNQPEIPWEFGADAPLDELMRILPSLRGWQLGETSDGRHLLKAAGNYAKKVGDPEFVAAVELFIREEQRHGENLGRFLDLAGVPRARFDWGDWLFRSVRYFVPSMEVWATPVVMVETHAMIYYNALRRATSSRVLQAICRQILIDEVPHIRFQCQRLAILCRHRSRRLFAVTRLGRRLFFTAVTLAIWLGHHRALQAGGYTFSHYWRSAWSRMARAWRQADPAAYEWSAEWEDVRGSWPVESTPHT